MIERITELSAPPVVGQCYMVPTVDYGYLGYKRRPWPVFLPLHNDVKAFPHFPWDHYHVDPRFLPADARWIGLEGLQSAVLHVNILGEPVPMPARIWRRRKCVMASVPYVYGHRDPIVALAGRYAGQVARRNRCGLVCPHQHFPMGSLEPGPDGVITCPLHGLRLRADTGEVLAPRQA